MVQHLQQNIKNKVFSDIPHIFFDQFVEDLTINMPMVDSENRDNSSAPRIVQG